jgi:magnesium transporter
MKNIEELIDSLHLEDLRNEVHPSIFDDNQEYNMLIVRIPEIDETLNVKSIGFIITKQNSYFYNKEKQRFEELSNRFESPYKTIDTMTDNLLKSFIKYQDKVADIEENLYKNNINNSFLNNWLELKLEILRIERVLHRASNTINQFIDFYKDIESFPMNHYLDLHEHMERTMRSATLQLSKLDYLYSFYNAKSNDKMNRMIYVLTIISSIFLPLNLVVGFFGMNTSSLPFATGDYGTYYAISLMIFLIITTSLIVQIWRKKVEK